MCLHGMGQYYLVVGKNSEATSAFMEAVDIARQVYGENDLQVYSSVVFILYCQFLQLYIWPHVATSSGVRMGSSDV